MSKKITVSTLPKTWILDLDGTIVKHNGFKLDGHDSFLPGAEEFLKNIPQEDMVIFITSRAEAYRGITERFLRAHSVRYNGIVCGAPYGERILVNDRKPSGLGMAIAVNTNRDHFMDTVFVLDEAL